MSKKIIFNVSLLLTIVIGVGIFFKNESIIAAAHGSSWIVILSWVLGGLLSIGSAWLFAEMTPNVRNNDGNYGEFFSYAYTRKSGKIINGNFSLVYYSVYTYAIAVFVTNYVFFGKILNIPVEGYAKTFLSVFISLILIFSSFILKLYANKISTFINLPTAWIQLIPFIIVIFILVSLSFTGTNYALWNKSTQEIQEQFNQKEAYKHTMGMSNIAKLFWVIPITKFAYDGYLTLTANKKESSPRAIKYSLVIGMFLVMFLYVSAAIVVVSQGEGSIPDAISMFFGRNNEGVRKVVLLFIYITVVICGIGSINGFTNMWFHSIENYLEENHFKPRTSKKNMWITFIFSFLFSNIVWIILLLSFSKYGAVTEVIDPVSDIVLLISFAIEAIIVGKVIYKKFQGKNNYSLLFVTISILMILSLSLIIGYKVIDGMILEVIKNPNSSIILSLKRWTYPIIFVCTAIIFFSSHYFYTKFIAKYLHKQ